jgi:hypothetical protein
MDGGFLKQSVVPRAAGAYFTRSILTDFHVFKSGGVSDGRRRAGDRSALAPDVASGQHALQRPVF